MPDRADLVDTRGRLVDLLTERATIGLDAAAMQELAALLDVHPEWANDTFDLAAVAIDRALAPPSGVLPGHLRARLEARAMHFDAGAGKPETPTATPVPVTPPPVSLRPSTRPPTWAGWLAAAAALAVAALAWWPAVTRVPGPVRAESEAGALEATPGVMRLPLQSTADPAADGASGEVIWSPARQSGFLRIRGLAPNEPARWQYQLWLFDARRDDSYPVDGGVFDVPAGSGEILVGVRNALPVAEVLMFAITVERPGGVVVSRRERVVLLAQVPSDR